MENLTASDSASSCKTNHAQDKVSNCKVYIWPYRLCNPLMLQGKSILQELCSLHFDWDDPIPEDVKMRWEKWRMELMKLQSIKIPRCYKPKGFGHDQGRAASFQWCKVHCAFVTGKSRAAPLKPVPIPRLILTAAVCSVRISQQIHHELEYRIGKDLFWTDSKVLLGYHKQWEQTFSCLRFQQSAKDKRQYP